MEARETDIPEELARDLNAPEMETRLAAAAKTGKLIRSGRITRSATLEFNNHVHTSYSFCPYSPSMAAYLAWKAGLQTVGIMDHDSVSGCAEMLRAAQSIGIASTAGFELRVNMTGTKLEGRKINNPDSSNNAYIAIHGIPKRCFDKTALFLEPVCAARNGRNRRMTENLNREISGWGVGALDYEKDIHGISQSSDGGSVTERHLLFALCNLVIESIGQGTLLVDFLEKSAGLVIPSKIKEVLSDSENPYYAYDLLGFFKTAFVSKIYEQPGEDECVSVRTAIDFARSIDAIAAYAYLGDVTDSPTGDKKAEAFEDSFLDELFDEIKVLGFKAITYMPPRNTMEQLRRVQRLCSDFSIMEISGVDINSPRQSFNCPELLLPEFRHLADSAWALIAHEKLSDLDSSLGLFDPSNPLAGLSLPRRIEVWSAIGSALDPASPESALSIANGVIKESSI